MARMSWMTLAALASLGCGSAIVEGDPPKMIAVAPVDGTTNLGATDPVQFVARFRDAGLPATDRTAILAGLGLATWPDMTPLAADVTLAPATVGSVPALDVFTVTPRSALPDGWYAATGVRLPDDLLWTDPLDHSTTPAGSVSVRVRVGSAPAPLRAAFCEKSDSSVAVETSFSEAVVLTDSSLAAPFSVAVNGMTCAASWPAQPAAFTTVHFDCPGALLTDTFAMAVSDGLSSPSGVPVQAVRVTTTPSALAIDGTGCNGYKFDL